MRMFRLRSLKIKTHCTRRRFRCKTRTDGITYFQDYVFIRINRFQNATFPDVLCINFYSRRSYRDTEPGTRNPYLKTVYYEFSQSRIIWVSKYRWSRDVETFFFSPNNNDLHAGRGTHSVTCVNEHELQSARRVIQKSKNIDNDYDNDFPGVGEDERN